MIPDHLLDTFLNSNDPADRARARAACAARGLDEDAERRRILAQMVADGRALMERQARGESATQSGYRKDDAQ